MSVRFAAWMFCQVAGICSVFMQGGFFSCKSPLLPLRGNSPEKSASQDKAFRRVRAAAGAPPLDPAIF
ncbi:hypothetical protein D7Y41_24630 [Anaerotruncus sp. 1XD22-93]|nr:hypothetical protein D7Y41_24630 [Anaerotruncus sp. 1XD22-93]